MHVIRLYVYNEKEERNEQLCKKSDCSAVADGGGAIVGRALGSSGALLMMMIISYILIKLCVRA